MTNNKLGLVAPTEAARPIQIMQADDRMPATAFDESIRAQLLHVAIGVGGTGTRTVRMLVDVSVYLSLESYVQGGFKSGVIVIPGKLDGPTEPHDDYPRKQIEVANARWKSVCTKVYSYTATHGAAMQSPVGDAFTLRLLFDAFGERQASDMADVLCAHFGAWQQATTSLREAMAAIRSTLLEPQRTHYVYMPMLYRSAAVCKGWPKRIIDPVRFLHCDAMEDSWSEPRLPSQLSDLFAARFEALWSETAKALNAPEPPEDEAASENEDLADSTDAADDFVCADRMLTLWYGSKRPRRRRI